MPGKGPQRTGAGPPVPSGIFHCRAGRLWVERVPELSGWRHVEATSQ